MDDVALTETRLREARAWERTIDSALIAAQAEREDAEDEAEEALRLAWDAGQIDRDRLTQLYWQLDGLSPGRIARVIEVPAGSLWKYVDPFVIALPCPVCRQDPIDHTFTSRKALEDRRPSSLGLCDYCLGWELDRSPIPPPPDRRRS